MDTDKPENARSPRADVGFETAEDGAARVVFSGRLDADTVADLWARATDRVRADQPARLAVDASDVDYCDGAGMGLFLELYRIQVESDRQFSLVGATPDVERVVSLFSPEDFCQVDKAAPTTVHIADETGRAAVRWLSDMKALVSYVGQVTTALVWAARHPGRVRTRDLFTVAETAGVNALPIISLVSFLVGLIMAFQAATAMKPFGVQVYVANLVALSILRELGPLMTAIVLAGRSASAFAAEIGTMTVNEEVDALKTMGLDPLRFLVVPRVVAAVAMTPILAVFANLVGLVGGAVVFLAMGFPLVTYFNQIGSAVDWVDLTGGLVKCFVFGLLIAATGCLRGLQTGTGPQAVGDSTTSAVVSGIVLIVATDGVFSVIYYTLGI